MLGRIDAIDADIAALDARDRGAAGPSRLGVGRLDAPGIGPVAAAIILAEIAAAGRQRRSDDLRRKLSGSARTDRPGLAAMLDYARPGDTVVVTAIDRLGRSVAEVTRTIADLGERRITLRALREGVDTATPTGRAVAAIMATLAELELELGREPRAASREARRARSLPATKPTKLMPSVKCSYVVWRPPVSLCARWRSVWDRPRDGLRYWLTSRSAGAALGRLLGGGRVGQVVM